MAHASPAQSLAETPYRVEVVIVDDDADSLSEMEEFVSDIGYACLAFTSPEQALAHLRERERPVVLLSDVRMPQVSGLELSRLVREQDEDKAPIETILFSGHSGFSEAVEALKIGIVDFLVKPIDLRRLERTIAQACERIRDRLAVRVRDERLQDFLAGLVETAQHMVAPQGGRRWCLRPHRPCRADTAPAANGRPADPVAPELDSASKLALIKLQQTNRRMRDRLFSDCVGGDAAWEIILFVMEQQLLGRPVSVTSACHATAIPQTTALRKIDELVESGHLLRTTTPDDRRRVLLRVTADCEEALSRYLEATQAQFSVMARTLARGGS